MSQGDHAPEQHLEARLRINAYPNRMVTREEFFIVRLESFTIDELNAFVLALRHMAQRFTRRRKRDTRTIYDALADRLLPVLRNAEQTTFTPVQIAGTVGPVDSTLPPVPQVPLLAFNVEELYSLWSALVEDAAALGQPRGPKESLESLRYRKRRAVVVKRAAAHVNRISARARSKPAAHLGVP